MKIRILILILFVSYICGSVNAAVEFDGSDDYLDLGSSLTLSPDITVSVWVKSTDTHPNENHAAIVSRWSDDWILWTYNSNLRWGDATSDEIQWVGGATAISDGNWHHIVALVNASNGAIYVDNDLKVSENGTFSIGNNNRILIGAYNDGATGRYGGLMDDLRIYDRSISTVEIETLYRSRSKRLGGSLSNGLVAHYEMDNEPIGNRISPLIDSSSNSNHGDFKNFSDVISAFNGDVPANIGAGKSLKLDGVNDYINIENPNLDSLNAFTVTMWLKPNNAAVGNWFGKWNSFSNPGTSKQILFRNNFEFFVRNASDSAEASASRSGLTNGVWNFISAVGNGSEIQAGVNNSFGTATAFAGPYIPPSSDNWAIGAAHSSYLNGLVDEVRVYSKALSASELAFLYNGSGVNPGTSNLEALWTFDEDINQLIDASGNDNHAVGSGGSSLKYEGGILKR